MKIFLFISTLVTIAMSDSSIKEVLKVGNDQFTAKFFDIVTKSHANDNFVISAFSVLSPLAQLALASVGSSHDEILSVIGMPNDNVTKEAISDVNVNLRAVKGVEMKQANKVYVRSGYTLNDEFLTVSKQVFDSEVQNINFKNQQKAADEINKWVEDHTNNRIQNLVDPTTLTDETAVVLVNAIFFKGNWKTPFKTYATQDSEFFITKDKKVTKPMMHQTAYFKYGESDEIDAKYLEMSYEGDETSLVVVLPNQNDGIDSLVEKLKDPGTFTKGRSAMYYDTIEVSLPKFKIETTTDLKDVLQKINIKKLFIEKQAHLNNLIKGEDNLYVSDATQKAFIEVNEEGTEAAAANKFGVAFATSLLVPVSYRVFNADHPFVFYIMNGDIILFNGLYRS